MSVSTNGRASFPTQANAFLIKSICYQKRNKCQNISLLLIPLVVIFLLAVLERKALHMSADDNDDKEKEKEKDKEKPPDEFIKDPLTWPPALEIPSNEVRAVRTKFMPFTEDLPSASCRASGDCPVIFLLTGTNKSLVMGVAANMFPTLSTKNSSKVDNFVLGTEETTTTYLFDPAFDPSKTLYYIQNKCGRNSSISIIPGKEARCLQGLHLWRNSTSDINSEIYKGSGGNKKQVSNQVAAALDFSKTSRTNFNVCLWSNPTGRDQHLVYKFNTTRLPRLVNLASKAYLQELQGPGAQMVLEFVKDVPIVMRVTSLLAPFLDLFLRILCVAIPLYPFNLLLSAVVYEKEKNLRIMMKMHGLRDTAYWVVSYIYGLVISVLYILIFVISGKVSGLAIFTKNDLSLQLCFYLLHMNWQIAFVIFAATFVPTVRTAQVLGTTMISLTILVGFVFLKHIFESEAIPRYIVILVEMVPGFALYRGAYEFQKYATFARDGAETGMKWQDLNDSTNGLKTAMIVMAIEWLVMILLGFYLDQVLPSGSGQARSPFFFLQSSRRKPLTSNQQQSMHTAGSQGDNKDVAQERQKVEQLVSESSGSHTVLCHNIKKIYPGRDGNPPKAAVRGLSLALSRSECFGMLGPNGAGKTSFISMMIGLTEPTSGTAYVEGLDLTTQIDQIYSCMGVCPQFDLLWETLTAREHLYFYGRLKNLKGSALTQAVEDSLKAVNLFHGGVADKFAGKYSGGMKRRLSVAISLIGDPKIVYLDEPSTGLDPASRNQLWSLVKRAKQNRAILLTTHSMEEAEALCDRLGVFVDGGLQCVGHPTELKARYGGFYIFTMTTTPDHDADVEVMVLKVCSKAHKTYHIGGTQKFELPKNEVRLADVFILVESAKSSFPVQAWALADTTLEDVFIKVTRQAQAKSSDNHS